jgi:hypothetical protein
MNSCCRRLVGEIVYYAATSAPLQRNLRLLGVELNKLAFILRI